MQDMRKAGVLSHTGTDSSDFSKRAKDAGYDGRPTGENVAVGQKTPEQVWN